MGWNVVVLGGLMVLGLVFLHLKAILMFVFLNMFVTLRICGQKYVSVVHLLFFFVLVCNVVRFVLCFIWCRSFCIIFGGRKLRCAMCRNVDHSLFWRSELSGRLIILSI